MADVAELLGVPVKMIYDWQLRGTGPRALKIGRYLRFRPSDLAEWIEALAPTATKKIAPAVHWAALREAA